MSALTEQTEMGSPALRTGLGRNVFRCGPVSFRYHPRLLTVYCLLAFALLILCLWSLCAGDFPISLEDLFAALTGRGEGIVNFILFGVRAPRILTGIFVGMAFGISGAIFQSLARNPLASPDVIGFNSGAAFGAMLMIVVFNATGALIAIGALGGGLLTAVLVFGLAWQNGIAPLRLVLVGIGVGFFAYAGVEFLMTRSDIFEAAAAQAWRSGSLNARNWTDFMTVLAGVVVLGPIALYCQKGLDRIELGDALAAGLGIRVEPIKLLAAIVAVLLAAIAVACAGPLTFVAFVAAPIARRLADAPGVAITGAALVGALVVTAGDLAGRLMFAPMQLPVGIFTAVFGAPYLLWLLATQFRKGTM